jgi:hypothetical protein
VLEQAAIPLFANHQTFHPRFGWIKKGYDAAAKDPAAFSRASAPVDLGVGKNMVEAIRFWALATKVLVKQPHPDRPRLSIHTPTRIGRALLDDRLGLDPYAEDLTTLWILHWHALSTPSFLPIWRLVFNDLAAVEFTENDLFLHCAQEIAATSWSQPSHSSIRKDVDCLLRMYCRRGSRRRDSIDDFIDSPFSALHLIRSAPGADNETYRFSRGTKRGLTAAAITYACLDFMSRDGRNIRTISISRLALEPGSPGRLLKIAEQDIADAIESSMEDVVGLQLARPAGSRQLAVESDPTLVALAVLCAWYGAEARLERPEELDVAGHNCTGPVLSEARLAKLLRRCDKEQAKQKVGGDAA